MKRPCHSLFYQFILLSAIICGIVAVAFCTMLFYVRSYSLRSSRQVLENLHRQTFLRTEEYYAAIENEAYIICYSPALQEYMLTDSIAARIDLLDNLKSLNSGAFLVLDSLIGIAVFDFNGTPIRSSKTSLFAQEGLPESLTDITRRQYTGVFAPDTSSGISQNSFAMLSPVYNLLSGSRLLGNRIGIIALTFSTDQLTAIIKSNGTAAEQFYLILTDADHNVIAASSGEAAAYYQDQIWNRKAPAAHSESTLTESGWHLYSYMPHTFLRAEIKPLLLIVTVTGILFLSFLVLLIAMLRQKILRPISKLSGFMARVPEDTQPMRFKTNANNELGSMIHVLNRMLDELNRKNEQLRNSETKIYAMELSRKDVEILAYRNQINPHFLYNTLDCICSMAMYHGADDVAQVSESLSTMFRYAVKGDSLATISQEISYVQEYSSIISHRFMNRISILVDAAPETLPLRTIKLLIQPLVENAVFHGLERQVGPGTVSVKISLNTDGKLLISVRDDGIGIPDETLAALQVSIVEAQSDTLTVPATEKSIGLRNIARRIHLYYNGLGTIRLYSTEGSGTTVTIILPLKEGGSPCTMS